MNARREYRQIHADAPAIARSLRDLSAAVKESGLEPGLVELVRVRSSQINGCAFCLDMHFRDALKLGERPERLLMLDAWREASDFSARERAALAWTEALTLITEGHVPDAVYAEAAAAFSEKELANLTAAVITINAWNRVMIAYRIPPAKPS